MSPAIRNVAAGMSLILIILVGAMLAGQRAWAVMAYDAACSENGKPAREGKGCGQESVNGGIVNKICQSGFCNKAESSTNTDGKKEDLTDPKDVQQSAQQSSADLSDADYDRLNQDTIRQIESGNAPELSQEQSSDLRSAVNEVQALDPARSQSLIDSFMQSPEYQQGFDANLTSDGFQEITRQYTSGAVIDPNPGPGIHFFGSDPFPLIFIPEALSPGLDTGMGYMTSPAGETVVYNSNIWSPSSFGSYTGGTAGIPSNAIMPVTNSGGFITPNYSADPNAWNPNVSPFQSNLAGNGLNQISGQGAVFQPATVGGGAGMSLPGGVPGSSISPPGNLSPEMQTRWANAYLASYNSCGGGSICAGQAMQNADLAVEAVAQGQGTIDNYLASGGGCGTFGSCLGQGIQSVSQNVTDAWNATTQAVRDAFFPSAALDTAPSFEGVSENASIQGDFSLTNVPSVTSESYGMGETGAPLSPVVADSIPALSPVSDTPTQDVPPPAIEVVDITSPGIATDPLSFDSGTVQNAVARGNALGSGGNPNSVSPFIGGASPVSFEIDRSGVPASPNLSSGSQGTPFSYFTQTYTGTAFPNPSANFQDAPTYPGVDYYAAGVQDVPGTSATPSASAPVSNNGAGGTGLGGPAVAPAAPAAPAAPSQGNASNGIGSLMQGLSGLLSALKGGGGSGSGGSATPTLPPVTVAPATALATPAATTNFAPAVPLTPAPQILVVANPNPVAQGAQATISWSAQWSQATSSASRECAVIDVHGTKLVTESAVESSVQTPALARAMYFIVGCKEQGGLLGSQVVLVKVQGDDTPPESLPQGLGVYQSVSGYSDAAAELSAAISGTSAQPAQAANVACDPNLSNYIDCLTGKMLYVDKLY